VATLAVAVPPAVKPAWSSEAIAAAASPGVPAALRTSTVTPAGVGSGPRRGRCRRWVLRRARGGGDGVGDEGPDVRRVYEVVVLAVDLGEALDRHGREGRVTAGQVLRAYRERQDVPAGVEDDVAVREVHQPAQGHRIGQHARRGHLVHDGGQERLLAASAGRDHH